MNILVITVLIAFFGLFIFLYLGYRTYSKYVDMMYQRSLRKIQEESIRNLKTKKKDKKPVDGDEYLSREKNTRQAAKNVARGLEESSDIDNISSEEGKEDDDISDDIYIYDLATGKKYKRKKVNKKTHYPNSIAAKYKDQKIVGLVKPIGRWTKFVIQQQGVWLAMRKLFSDKKGYWENMIYAQASGQMYEQSRGKGGREV